MGGAYNTDRLTIPTGVAGFVLRRLMYYEYTRYRLQGGGGGNKAFLVFFVQAVVALQPPHYGTRWILCFAVFCLFFVERAPKNLHLKLHFELTVFGFRGPL